MMMRNFLVLIFAVLISFSNIIAQNSSAYTRYGIGDMDYSYSSKMAGIGGLGTTILDNNHIIVSNPASWSSLDLTRVEFSLSYGGVSISDGNESSFSADTDIKGFTFGFPVSRTYGIGVVAGLVPYSRVSYKSVKTFEANTQQNLPGYNLTFEGIGGLSKLFIGSSVKLPFNILLGASLDYYFGNIRYFSNIDFDQSDNLSAKYEKTLRPTGFGTTAGIISPNLAKDLGMNFFSDLRVGFSINYLADLDTDTLLTSTSLIFVDTIGYSSVRMNVPPRINGGISFVFDNEYNINVDYAYQAWSNYTLNNRFDENLRDASKISAALEYKPKRGLGMSVWEQIIWRAGLSYEQTQYTFNGIGIDQYSAFGGLSFPLGVDNSIDIALVYSKRGTTENNLLKENFIKLYLGISFGELWFLRFDK
jgi:hypothetical protein